MNTEFIKYHPGSNTYIVQRKAYFEDSVLLKGNLIVGAGCNFWQELRVEGNLELGKNLRSGVMCRHIMRSLVRIVR
jgi:hypothetical protein